MLSKLKNADYNLQHLFYFRMKICLADAIN